MTDQDSQDTQDGMLDLASVANVVEDLAGRPLTLGEWQQLDDLLEAGTSEEETVKQVLAACAAASPEDFVELEDAPTEEIGLPATQLPESLEGNIAIISHDSGSYADFMSELAALGLTPAGVLSPDDLARPVGATGGLPAMDWVLIAESCALKPGSDFGARIRDLCGGRQGVPLFLIDEDLDLFERWDGWPFEAVLAQPVDTAALYRLMAESQASE